MKKPKVCIITFPISNAGIIPTSHLVDIVHPLSSRLYLLTGNEGYLHFKNDNRLRTYGVKHESKNSPLLKMLFYMYTQLRISYLLVKFSRSADVYIFFIGGECLILPMIVAKLFNKKVVLSLAGSTIQSLSSKKSIFLKTMDIIFKTDCILSDNIILYGSNLMKNWDLTKYESKISIAHEHFLNFYEFCIKNDIVEREDLVGFVGRFTSEKGIINFIESIPMVSKIKPNLKFLLIGEGLLENDIKKRLTEYNLNDRVNIIGWISHKELHEYLNILKLIVIPSYTEGLPNIMLEAMACGTPVLATAVGVIPDIIIDGKTGFIMDDNSAENISKNIIRALEYPNISDIVNNSNELVKNNFSYDNTVKLYGEIIANL